MRVVWIIIGVLAILAGVTWTLQGLDLLGQSGGMNGQTMWAIIGPIVAVVGLLLLIMGIRKKKTAA
jgi:cytochrome bd-type quinol oxidase subunit 2